MRLSLYLMSLLGAAALVIAGSSPAACETLDELKGLSISYGYKEHALRKMVGSNNDVRHDQWSQAFKIYIGSAGNIFEYAEFSLGKTGSSKAVRQLDKSLPSGNDTLCHDGSKSTFTFLNGHFSMIFKEPEGLKTFTITVDPTAMVCKLSISYQADAVTGKIIQGAYGTSCARFENLSDAIDSTDCAVKRGNIFADDK